MTHIICTKCGGKGCKHCNNGWQKDECTEQLLRILAVEC